METTSPNQEQAQKERTRFGEFFSNIFGGEILAKKKMLPWYAYFLFVTVLITLLVISEQRIHIKQKKITALENSYKLEISRLKASNQFIPYEKNKILLQKMTDKGFVTTESQIFTVKETPKPVKERRWYERKEADDED